MEKKDFNGKRVLLMGLGRFGGGVDVVKFAHKAGAKVTVTDLAGADKLADSLKQIEVLDGIEYHLGSHDKTDFEQADIIIANPAIPDDNEFLQIARKNNKVVTCQINIFFELCPATIIGITGSNGKSTTTALTAHLLRESKKYPPASALHPHDAISNKQHESVWLTGNIGNEPFLCLLDKIKPNDLVVMEISSFQIEQLAQIRRMPKLALLTNLTPNHLDRYGTFEKYCAAKENIFKFQTLETNNPAVSIFNADDPIANKWFEKYKEDRGRTCIRFSASETSSEIKKHYQLPGWANLQNLAASLSIVRRLGITDEQIKKALPNFKALPHRLELVGEKNGVRWFNDSKATTPESTIVALQAFDNPIVLIAGGYDKHIPFDTLGVEIAKRAKAAILIGQTAQKIYDSIQSAKKHLAPQFIGGLQTEVVITNSMEQAVKTAKTLAISGDVVLLSPACASYDMFENYVHRGNEFARLVKEL